MTQITIDSQDVGVLLEATLTFTSFDPTGGTAELLFTGLAKPQERRDMSFDGISVASYTIAEGDFKPGYYTAQVQVTKGSVKVSSEQFQIAVTP